MNFIYLIFFSFGSRDQWTLILKKFYWPLLYCRNSGEKIFFFPQNFSTNQNSRKMKFIYLIFCSFDSRDQWTLILKKFYWPLLYCRNSEKKFFFFLKIFRPIRIREKIEFHYSIFYSLESRDQWTLILKKFYWPLLYCRNSGEKIFFFPQNFSTNQNSRKMKFIFLFDFFLVRIERPMNTDTKKILLTFVVLSKFGRKNFFPQNSKFFDQSEFEKNEIHLFDFLLVRIERPMNTDAKKSTYDLCCIVEIREKNEKKFFFFWTLTKKKFFDQSIRIGEKIEFHYSIFYSLESRDQWTLILKKFYWPLLYCRNSGEKIFFFPQNFSTNQNSRKMKFIYLIFCSFDSRDQWTLMLKKFYWPLLYCRNQREKNFFFYKIFRPIRIGEKIEFHYSIFYSLESRDQWTLILKKFYWPLLYCRNSGEKIFFFPSKFFDQSEFEKNEIHLFDFLLVRFERPMNTDAKKILLTSVVLSKSARKKFFFFTKFFDQSELEKKSNSIIRFFTHWNRETNEHWY